MKKFLTKILKEKIPSSGGFFSLFRSKVNIESLKTFIHSSKCIVIDNVYEKTVIKTYLITDEMDIHSFKGKLFRDYKFKYDKTHDVIYLKESTTYHILLYTEFIIGKHFKNDIFDNFLTNTLKLSTINKHKYKFDLESVISLMNLYKIKASLESKYKLVHFQKNTLIINDNIESTNYIYGNGSNFHLYDLPANCKTTIYQIEFYTNANNELAEVKVISNNKNHPNIDYRTNKFCIGNFRFKPLTEELVVNVINNIKIYNLVSSYNIPKNLKRELDKIHKSDKSQNIHFI